MIPSRARRFIGDVLDAYAQVGDEPPVSFYQMEVELRRP